MKDKTVNINNFIVVYDNYITKEECDRMLKELVDQGQNPGDLKAVPQDDPRYPTEKQDPGYIPTNL